MFSKSELGGACANGGPGALGCVGGEAGLLRGLLTAPGHVQPVPKATALCGGQVLPLPLEGEWHWLRVYMLLRASYEDRRARSYEGTVTGKASMDVRGSLAFEGTLRTSDRQAARRFLDTPRPGSAVDRSGQRLLTSLRSLTDWISHGAWT